MIYSDDFKSGLKNSVIWWEKKRGLDSEVEGLLQANKNSCFRTSNHGTEEFTSLSPVLLGRCLKDCDPELHPLGNISSIAANGTCFTMNVSSANEGVQRTNLPVVEEFLN